MNDTLKKYHVSYYEEPGDHHFQVFECMAEDSDHADEQTENAYPNCVLINTIEIKECF